MKGNLVFKIFFSILFLGFFCVYSYMHFSSGWTTNSFADTAASVDESSQPPAQTDTAAQATPQPTVEPTPVPTEEPGSDLPDVDLTSWEMILVNKDNSVDENFAPPETSTLANDCVVDSRIAEALTSFAEGAQAEGLPVYLSSGYRDYSTQQYLYNRKISQGYSAEEAAKIVTPPGTSEHQTGLCCDITDYYRDPKTTDLENTETFQWLLAHCQEYGFILRYPEDKQDITQVMYEPWHFRYVGVEAATYIMENNLCLEEFVALYDEA